MVGEGGAGFLFSLMGIIFGLMCPFLVARVILLFPVL